MLLHSPKKKLDADLNLEIDGTAVEQVRVFKYLGVLINDTLTWSDRVDMVSGKVSPLVSISLEDFLGFSPNLFYYFISNLTFFHILIIVMLFGLDAHKRTLTGLKLC